MKYLVPLARAKRVDCERLVAGLDGRSISVREMERLYMGWKRADAVARDRIVAKPWLFLQAEAAIEPPPVVPAGDPAGPLLDDLQALCSAARRGRRRLRDGLCHEFDERRRALVHNALIEARATSASLFDLLQEELGCSTATPAPPLALSQKGLGVRAIAKALGVSRNSVRKVLESGELDVPPLQRSERLDSHVARVRELHHSCKGNLVRVHEELVAAGIDIAYPTLTSFCRRNGIGQKPKVAAGQYHFGPGEEMQHDTSPHDVVVGRKRRLQCASLILCYSRRQYAQVYPRWSRFEARVFLTEALEYLGGAAARCMLDNSTAPWSAGPARTPSPHRRSRRSATGSASSSSPTSSM